MGIFSFLKANSQSEDEKGVVINGVRWATRNVDFPGTFAAKPEDSGMFYQWNCKKAWPVIGDVTGWDSNWDTKEECFRVENNWATVDNWERTNDPSPIGWRVPTLDEIEKLFDIGKVRHVWTTRKGVNGRKFTDKATGNSIFLPAVGYRGYKEGTLYHDVGGYSGYWSSDKVPHFQGYCLRIFNGNADNYCFILSSGLSVRSVAE